MSAHSRRGGALAAGEAAIAVDDLAADDLAADDLPEVLREDLERYHAARRARRRAILQVALALALTCTLVVQAAWFSPESVARSYPQARAALELLCRHTGCTMPQRREPSRVRVVARDVRVHPRFEGALQITATLINTAGHRQLYPRLQFNLFNVNGQRIASRVFEPSEYLAPGTDPGAQMRPDQPTQIELEVLAPEQVAVSFELRFL